jgi:hypothetical protein
MALFITTSGSSIIALSIVAFGVVACNSVQTPAFNPGQGAAQAGVNPSDRYSCYFADDGGADRVVAGRMLHWCGPVPRPKN